MNRISGGGSRIFTMAWPVPQTVSIQLRPSYVSYCHLLMWWARTTLAFVSILSKGGVYAAEMPKPVRADPW